MLVEWVDSSFKPLSNTADCDGNFKQKWIKLLKEMKEELLLDLWIIQISDGIWKEIPSDELKRRVAEYTSRRTKSVEGEALIIKTVTTTKTL